MLPRRQPMLWVSLIIILAGSLIICGWKSDTRQPKEIYRFGFQALKVNGKYVDPAVFQQEQMRFYMLWKRNGSMLRLSDEERNDLLLEKVINRVILEEYLYRQKQAQLDPDEVEGYIERYVKTAYPTAEAMQHYLSSVFCRNEAELKHQVKVYLMRLKCIPAIAQQYGITVSTAELEERERLQTKDAAHPRTELRAMLLTEKFLRSKEFDNWLAEIKKDIKIEITEPCLLAYRYGKSQQYQKAGSLYEKSYQKYRTEFYLDRAIVNYRSANNWNKVVKLSQTGIHSYPRQVPYYLYAAEGLYKKGSKRKAVKLLAQAQRYANGNVVYQEMIVQTYSKLGLKPPPETG